MELRTDAYTSLNRITPRTLLRYTHISSAKKTRSVPINMQGIRMYQTIYRISQPMVCHNQPTVGNPTQG